MADPCEAMQNAEKWIQNPLRRLVFRAVRRRFLCPIFYLLREKGTGLRTVDDKESVLPLIGSSGRKSNQAGWSARLKVRFRRSTFVSANDNDFSNGASDTNPLRSGDGRLADWGRIPSRLAEPEFVVFELRRTDAFFDDCVLADVTVALP
jgi:hypothetical protein